MQPPPLRMLLGATDQFRISHFHYDTVIIKTLILLNTLLKWTLLLFTSVILTQPQVIFAPSNLFAVQVSLEYYQGFFLLDGASIVIAATFEFLEF